MAKRKILFVDRDGTLIEAPADGQVDAFDKLRLIPEVIPALRRIRDLGYAFVMVTNQDGLGTEAFPEGDFAGPQALLLSLLESQGITFDGVLIDRTTAAAPGPGRKPAIGLVLDYLKTGDLDLDASAVVGNRETDLEFAANMGVRGFRLGADGQTWPEIAAELAGRPRRAAVNRSTSETRIDVLVDLDSSGAAIETGIGFLDHMLEQIARHADIRLELACDGDLHIDDHHTIEDCALALGEALRKALGDKRGIGRYGFCLPMDETQVRAAVDLGGRPYLRFEGEFPRDSVGGLATEMVPHFFRSLADALGATIHIHVDGENTHHMVEGCFKGLARALRPAFARTASSEVPSTKGMLA